MALHERLPRGATLPPDVWIARHRMMVALLWAHVPGLFVFALAQGYGLPHSTLEVVPVAALAAVASVGRLSRRARAAAISLGLLTCSALLVHLWNGAIEAHFHFFVMVAVLATYEEWFPYLLAIGYVVVHHGLAGALGPESVYAHSAGAQHPWTWAAIHGGFIGALAVVNLASWRLNENVRERQAESETRFRSAFDEAPMGMAIVCGDGTIQRVNGSFATRIERTPDELAGTRLHDLLPGVDLHASAPQELPFADPAGGTGWAYCQHSRLPDRPGQPPTYISHILDVSKRKDAEQQLDHQAHHDALTGLPNRKLFLRSLGETLEQGTDGVGVLFVDLDNFKLVNDTLGHGTGDLLLNAVADRMQRVLRPDDVVARLGGDEFAVLLRRVSGEPAALGVAERIAGALRAPFMLDGERRYVSASIGISLAEPQSGPMELVRDADAAMYRAKELGKARTEIFDASLRDQVVERVELEAALRTALEHDEMHLVFQPVVDLATGAIRSVEALLRWDHPEMGSIPPGRFIPVAEQSGLIGDIGTWVLRNACRQVATWSHEVEVAVNVSPRQLAAPAFPDHVRSALEASGLPPHRLCLEVTESAVVGDLELADRTLRHLRELGVRLAVDDFGVGYASLSQLKALPPVDVLKIDRSFIEGVLNGGEDRAIVEAVIGLAHSLGLQTVAEGIESGDQATALRELHCALGQGYHFARPTDPAAIQELLRRQGELVS